jgi:hypothetical protein
MATLSEQLSVVPTAERASRRAEILKTTADVLMSKEPYTFKAGPYTITASNPKLITDGFQVDVVAEKDGVKVPISNPVQFINPPVSVWVDGVVVDDTAEAFRRMLLRSVLS